MALLCRASQIDWASGLSDGTGAGIEAEVIPWGGARERRAGPGDSGTTAAKTDDGPPWSPCPALGAVQGAAYLWSA